MYRFKPITLIAAIDSYGGLSKNGQIPWKLKEDLENFKTITTGDGNNAVIMGRNTWKTIPDRHRGFQARYNVVISNTLSETDIKADNLTGAPVRLSRSFEDAIQFCSQNDKIENIFICGGADIYRTAIERGFVDQFHITTIDQKYDCDKFLRLPSRGINRTDLKTYGETYVKIEKSCPFYSNSNENKYLNLLENIQDVNSKSRDTRNAPTYSIFGPELKLNLQDGFPLLTTKYMYWRGIVEELLFFLRGETNSRILSDRNVRIWEPNTSREFLDSRGLYGYDIGDMGPMYGWNWRHFGADYSGANHNYTGIGHDQLRDLLRQLKFNPTSRRMILTTYDPSKVSQSVLAPCHGLVIQFYVNNDDVLHCKMYQRSSDSFLGLPFNIASYALLMKILCHVTGYQAGQLIISLGDCHLYKDHLPAVKEQLKRKKFLPPKLYIRKPFMYDGHESEWVNSAIDYIENLKYEDFELTDYRYHPAIRASMIP